MKPNTWSAIAGALLALTLTACSDPASSQAHARMRVVREMESIKQGRTHLYVVAPSDVISSLTYDRPADSLYSMFFNSERGMEVVYPRKAWRAAGSLVDRWGEQYSFSVSVLEDASSGGREECAVQIRSFGPNRLGDTGERDDIVLELPLGTPEGWDQPKKNRPGYPGRL